MKALTAEAVNPIVVTGGTIYTGSAISETNHGKPVNAMLKAMGDAAAHGGIQVIGGILDAGNMGQGDDHIALLLAAEQLGHLDAGLGGGAELDALRVQCEYLRHR